MSERRVIFYDLTVPIAQIRENDDKPDQVPDIVWRNYVRERENDEGYCVLGGKLYTWFKERTPIEEQ